jgi:hypothetical protein
VQGTFKGFLVLRLIGLLVLVIVVALVLGIWALARGEDVAGVAILACVGILTAATRSIVVRRIGEGRRSRGPASR